MNMAFLPNLSTVGFLFVCLLLAPLLGGLVAGAKRSFLEKSQGQPAPSILNPLRDFSQRLLTQPMTGTTEQSVILTLHLAFNILALAMLTLQMNLLPIIFVQAFAASALIIAQMEATAPLAEQCANRAMKNFLTEQPLLLVVAIGVFFATGTFKIIDVLAHPKLLLIDSPFLLLALLAILYRMQINESAQPSFDGPSLALVQLAQCYRTVFLLLFAGLFFAHDFLWAILAAGILYLMAVMSEHIPAGSSRRGKFEWNWGYAFFACGLNLTWVYLKYWL